MLVEPSLNCCSGGSSRKLGGRFAEASILIFKTCHCLKCVTDALAEALGDSRKMLLNSASSNRSGGSLRKLGGRFAEASVPVRKTGGGGV